MSNPASFVTAATTDGNNTFVGDQTITGDLTITGDVTITGNFTHTGGATFSEVRAATTANITLSGAQTIDGVSVVAGNRVLVKNQGTASQNGIYTAAAGAWSRSDDLPAGASAAGLTVVVQEGTVSADVTYLCTNDVGSDVVGTNNLVFASGAVLDSLLVHKAGAENITGVKTFTEAPRVTGIADANGAEALVLPATPDAVNCVSIGNAATLNPVSIGVVGDDANIALDFAPKGTGAATLRDGNGSARIAVDNTGIGFHGLTPVAQGAHIPDAAGGATVDAEARAALNTLLAHLRLRGDLAAS